MRTDAVVCAVIVAASGARAEPVSSPFELDVEAEVTLVGLTAGLRPELLFRPGGEGTVSSVAARTHVRLQVILGADLMALGGPGFGFGPRFGVGWRF